ncbi:MAG: A/G-specific adenine glycosylase [Alphaproteobacteria bacterium]|nr:A/G-specific adenine glycosylase [Alphaproteobacteria bacterium]
MTVTEKLAKWYEKNGRDLPWRVKGGAHSNPYQVWISEIMLQQTTVKTVKPYFERFLKRFPNIETLAAAPIDDVLMLWQGLGYYTRARKLHECAKTLVEKYDGRFPADREKLSKLPGIGPYTSAAIAAFGFNLPETVVDGNVIRVLTRLKGWKAPVAEIMEQINSFADKLTKTSACPADHASAMMDLGSGICTPKSPLCAFCPLNKDCIACSEGLADIIPNITKLKKETKAGYVFWIENENKEVLLRKRTEKGLLSGLTELPWNTDKSFPFEANWKVTKKTVRHVFTHFDLTLTIVRTVISRLPENSDGFFSPIDQFKEFPFSTLMKKVVKKILNEKV